MNGNEKKKQSGLERADKSNPAEKKKKRIASTPVEEIRWDPNSIFKENKYYTRIAAKFRICKYATIVLLLVISMVMMTVFSSDITAENFQYLIKDLDFSGLTSSGSFDSIVYNGGNDSQFAIYREELAVVSNGQTSLYSASGASSFSKTNIFYSPALLTSDKYMLVYDKGNTSCSYSVYNSFAELKSEKLDYPITGAALSDNGAYAIITRDDTYRGVVRMFDRDFNLLTEIKKDKYVISGDITDTGNQLVLASVYDENGDYVTELMTVQAGDDHALSTVTVKGVMPMKIRYLDNANIAVLYTDRVALYSSTLEFISEIPFGSVPSIRADIGESLICSVYNKTVIGNDKTVNIYDCSGNLIFTYDCAGELAELSCYQKKVYLLFEDSVMMLDTENDEVKVCEAEPNAIDIVFTEAGLPLVCYAGKAVPVAFAEAESSDTGE